MIEVVRVEVHPDRAGRLQRGWSADRQEIVNLSDRRRLRRRRDGVSEAPAGAAECLRQP